MREAEEGDGGRGVEEGVEMRTSIPSEVFEGSSSCDEGGVGALGDGEIFFTLAFFVWLGHI